MLLWTAANTAVFCYVCCPHTRTHLQVSKSFAANPTEQGLAQLGFIVVTLGNRGGHPDRSKYYHNYGCVVFWLALALKALTLALASCGVICLLWLW